MTLRDRIAELVDQHGGLRAAARVLQIDHAYLFRLENGEKFRPGKDVLRKLGVRAFITYERIKP